jgi:hypothetical protein
MLAVSRGNLQRIRITVYTTDVRHASYITHNGAKDQEEFQHFDEIRRVHPQDQQPDKPHQSNRLCNPGYCDVSEG